LAPAPGRSSSLAVRKLLAETYWHRSKLAIARHQTDLALIQTDKAIKVVSQALKKGSGTNGQMAQSVPRTIGF